MALIECPLCRKRISSKAKQCSHCQAALKENNESLIKISQIQQSNRLLNQGFLFMTIFIAGIVIWFWGGEVAQGYRTILGGVCFVVGFVGYLVTRIRIILYKRNSR